MRGMYTSMGLTPRRFGTSDFVNGPIDVNPFTLPATNLLPGIYTVYLLVTPAGRLDSYYVGTASFIIP